MIMILIFNSNDKSFESDKVLTVFVKFSMSLFALSSIESTCTTKHYVPMTSLKAICSIDTNESDMFQRYFLEQCIPLILFQSKICQ